MKTRKILFSLSAIALALHAIWDIVRQFPFFSDWYRNCIWGHPLRIEIFWLPYTWLFLGGILLALIAVLVKTDEPKPTSKVYRYSTNAISIAYLAITVSGAVNAVQPYLYVPVVLRAIFDLSGCAWLMMLVFFPSNTQLPKGLRSLVWLGIGLIGMLWILQLISGISYLTTGHIMMFHSHALGNWLRYLVPTILLCCYSLYLLDKWPSPKQSAILLTRNSHCTPFSFFERSYPIMRIIALVGIGVALFLFYMVRMGADSYFHIYYFEDFDRFVAIVLLSIIGILWLLLTFMAFFQLPNPRKYKIFNWVFLVLNSCFPIGFGLSLSYEYPYPKAEIIAELMGIVGFCSLVPYILFTGVRVYLYTMPKLQGLDKLKDIKLKEGAIIPNGQTSAQDEDQH